jgi:2-polyprenyl-3-methyl-5-hydroxy-6-metoxy-1,4-benzoquinol methylase
MPKAWWSRPYEYYAAAQFLPDKGTIIDAGCGLEHPFKLIAADKKLKVTALDTDPRILQYGKITDADPLSIRMLNANEYDRENIEYVCTTFADYTPKTKADAVFCISVLEHMLPQDIEIAISKFASWLKPKGKLILTCDYPTIKPENLEVIVSKYFTIGPMDYKQDNNNISSQGLKVFVMVGEKA